MPPAQLPQQDHAAETPPLSPPRSARKISGQHLLPEKPQEHHVIVLLSGRPDDSSAGARFMYTVRRFLPNPPSERKLKNHFQLPNDKVIHAYPLISTISDDIVTAFHFFLILRTFIQPVSKASPSATGPAKA